MIKIVAKAIRKCRLESRNQREFSDHEIGERFTEGELEQAEAAIEAYRAALAEKGFVMVPGDLGPPHFVP